MHRGAARLQSKNRWLMEKFTYQSKNQICNVIRNLDLLNVTAKQGCEVAMCIRADFEKALNYDEPGTPYRYLTRRQAECFFDHTVLGYSQEDIAEKFGMSQSAVSKNVQTALSKIYLLLLEPDIEEQERREDAINEAYQKKIESRRMYFG